MDYKCDKCGTTYDGNVCPQCGAGSHQSQKCPRCGAQVVNNAKLCNNCGYAFAEQDNIEIQQRDNLQSVNKFHYGLCKFLNWSPYVIFALFAVLNFIFMALPTYNLLGKYPMGNVYDMVNTDFAEVVIALLIASSVATAYACIYPLLQKNRVFAHGFAAISFLAVLAVSVVLYLQIGYSGWTVDVAPKLLIWFCVGLFVISCVFVVTDVALTKRNGKYVAAKTEIKNNAKPTLIGLAYRKTKQWFASHKKAASLISVLSVAVVCALVFGVAVPIVNNVFRAERLSQVQLGDSKITVAFKIGEPYGDHASDTWEYYGDEMRHLFKQRDYLNNQIENSSDAQERDDLIKQKEVLSKKIQETNFRYIVVRFDENDRVTSLTYDARCNLSDSENTKTVKEIKFNGANGVIKVAEFAEKNTLQFSVTYKDGSYKMYSMPTNVETIREKNESAASKYTFPSYLTVTWKDDWGEYSRKVRINNNDVKFAFDYDSDLNKLYINGAIPSVEMLDFFKVDCPWASNEIKDIELGANFTDLSYLDLLPSFSGNLSVNKNNKYFYAHDNMLFDKKDNLLYLTDNVVRSKLFETEWYKSQPDGLVYLNNLLIGYKGEMPENYSLSVKEGTTKILNGAFGDCLNLTSVTIPDTVTTIGAYAFMSCSNLESITMPNSVTTIGSDVFNRCSSLISITIPDGVTGISSNMFASCSSLESITVGTGVTKIWNTAFYNCNKLKNIYYTGDVGGWCQISGLGNLLTDVRTVYINNEPLTLTNELLIPDTVTEIMPYAFYGCTNITSITIPDSVKTIGNNALYGSKITSIYYTGDLAGWCQISGLNYLMTNFTVLYINNERLTGDLVIPDMIKEIKTNTFYCCADITSVTIPDSVKEIGDYAFWGCSSVTSVTIGNGVTTIGRQAFRYCKSLKSVTIGKSVTSIGAGVFADCAKLEIKFNGTVEQWNNIVKGEDWRENIYGGKVVCSDGTTTFG